MSTMQLRPKVAETLYLAFLTLACLGMFAMRAIYSNSQVFRFLVWNLFLAAIPWIASTALYGIGKLARHWAITLPILCLWMVFFPNAPYIITDLFHLGRWGGAPIWFDLLMLLAFAWTGLMYGFASLWGVEQFLSGVVNKAFLKMLTPVALFVSAFGIYLGRFLRWNSWDVLSSPMGLFSDIAGIIFNPLKYPGAWGMTLLFGIFLNIGYISFKATRKPAQRERKMAAA